MVPGAAMASLAAHHAALVSPRQRSPLVQHQRLSRKHQKRPFGAAVQHHRLVGLPTRAAAVDVELASLSAEALKVSGRAQAILDRTGILLRDYRSHKASVSGWLASFQRQRRRPPGLLDAEATGDRQLMDRFQQYLMVRKRLLAELPYLRQQLTEALSSNQGTTAGAGTSSGSSSSSSKAGTSPVNANVIWGARTVPGAAAQVFSALQYKRQHPAADAASSLPGGMSAATVGRLASPGVPAAAAAAEAHPERASASSSGAFVTAAPAAAATIAAAPGSADLPTIVARISEAAAATPSAAAAAASAAATAAPSSTPTAAAVTAAAALQTGGSSSSSSAGGGDARLGHLLGTATSGTEAAVTSSKSRVTSAALAALEYKKQKASGKAQPAAAARVGTPALAVLQAPAPERPPAAAEAAAAAVATVPAVETAKFVVASGRQQVGVPTDERLDVLLQGVPGGLGAVSLPGATVADLVAPSAAAAAAAQARRQQQAAANSSQQAGATATAAAPAAVIITAKFDVNAAPRSRRVEGGGQLDEYLNGLSEASTALAVEQGLIDAQQARQGSHQPPQQKQQKQQQQQLQPAKQQQQQQEWTVALAAPA